jgi:hypothetical protein
VASILAGLEFIADASSLIGFTSQKLVHDCRVLATIYEQWVSENLEHVNDKPDLTMTKKFNSATRRVDIRYMQLLDNATRVLTALHTLDELDMRMAEDPHQSNTLVSVEDLTAVLVELTVRAVGVIEQDRASASSSKVAGNIMTNPQTAFIYMGESLLIFVDKIVELAGREWADGRRLKVKRNIIPRRSHLIITTRHYILTLKTWKNRWNRPDCI